MTRSATVGRATGVARMPVAVPLLALAAFVALAFLAVGDWAPLVRFDDAASEAFRAYGAANGALVAALRVVTNVAATVAYIGVGVAGTVLFLARGERTRAVFTALLTAVVPLVWSVMHWRVHSPRPADGFVTIDSSGFPSGHASNASAAALAVVLLVWPAASRRVRVAVCVAAVAFASFVAYTRVALLAHWPSDVIGGMLLALVVVPLAALVAPRISRE